MFDFNKNKFDENTEFRQIFNKYNFLAKTPLFIAVYLVVAIFGAGIAFFSWDFGKTVGWNAFIIFLLIVNMAIIIACICGIANIQQAPKYATQKELDSFIYRGEHGSLDATRWLQRSLIQPIESSQYIESTATRNSKLNNALRIFAFVVVFKDKAYAFVRVSEKISSRRYKEEIQEAIDDIAEDLDLSATRIKKMRLTVKLSLGYSRKDTYYVSKLN